MMNQTISRNIRLFDDTSEYNNCKTVENTENCTCNVLCVWQWQLTFSCSLNFHTNVSLICLSRIDFQHHVFNFDFLWCFKSSAKRGMENHCNTPRLPNEGSAPFGHVAPNQGELLSPYTLQTNTQIDVSRNESGCA